MSRIGRVLLATAATGILIGAAGTASQSASAARWNLSGVTADRPGLTVERSNSRASVLSAQERARHDLSPGEGSGPTWCTDNSGYQLGASFENIFACGPAYGSGDDFDTVGFQCVELSERFMWAVYGDFVPNVPDGKDLVTIANQQLGIPVGTPGVDGLPVPGDVVSMWGDSSAQPYGHTAVVTAVTVDGNGNGTVQLMEENGAASGSDQLNVNDWVETYGDQAYGGGIYYYDHVEWLELAGATPPPPQPALIYSVQPLGAGTESRGINNRGDVVGVVRPASTDATHTFLYQAGAVRALPSPSLNSKKVVAAGINDSGAVAGWQASPADSRGYVLPASPGATWRSLPLPQGVTGRERTESIDNAGNISGWVVETGQPRSTVAVLWKHIGASYQATLLPVNRYFSNGQAVRSDRWGDVVGSEQLSGTKQFATVWAPWGQAYRLPGLDAAHLVSSVTSMSVKAGANGRTLTVVGWSEDADGISRPCYWTVTVSASSLSWSQAHVLTVPAGFGAGEAVGVDRKGWVVGNMARAGSAGRAFLWQPGLGMSDLDSLVSPGSGWVILKVLGLNNRGQIVGQAYNSLDPSLSQSEAVILTPGTAPPTPVDHRST